MWERPVRSHCVCEIGKSSHELLEEKAEEQMWWVGESLAEVAEAFGLCEETKWAARECSGIRGLAQRLLQAAGLESVVLL